MDDQPQPAATNTDDYTLSIEDAVALYEPTAYRARRAHASTNDRQTDRVTISPLWRSHPPYYGLEMAWMLGMAQPGNSLPQTIPRRCSG
jgi:hypothetical protein